MPKAVKTGRSQVSSNSDSLFIYNYKGKRVIAKRMQCYRNAIQMCRSIFPDIPLDRTITFNTRDLAICENEMAVITEATWEMVVGELKSVVVTAEQSTETVGMIDMPPDSQVASRPISIKVSPSFGAPVELMLRGSTKISKVIDVIASKYQIMDPRSLIFTYDGQRMCGEDTVEDFNIKDGDEIDCRLEQLGGKPVIYLFSPTSRNASVKLSLAPQWDFSAIYPVVPIKPRTKASNEEVFWNVEVHPNGDLTELTTGLNVAYLFWEAHTNPSITRSLIPPPSPGTPFLTENVDEIFYPDSADLSHDDSVVLSIDKITPYLDKALSALCLHTEARTSFITYWLPSLLKHKHVALRFVPQTSYEHAAPLAVSPAPDIITRIFMIFKGVTDDELDGWSAAVTRAHEDVQMWQDVVGVNAERAQDATLFRVLEWGGMEVLSRGSS